MKSAKWLIIEYFVYKNIIRLILISLTTLSGIVFYANMTKNDTKIKLNLDASGAHTANSNTLIIQNAKLTDFNKERKATVESYGFQMLDKNISELDGVKLKAEYKNGNIYNIVGKSAIVNQDENYVRFYKNVIVTSNQNSKDSNKFQGQLESQEIFFNLKNKDINGAKGIAIITKGSYLEAQKFSITNNTENSEFSGNVKLITYGNQEKTKKAPADKITITADHLDFQNDQKMAVFTKNVKMIKNGKIIYSDKAIVYLNKKNDDQGNNQIKNSAINQSSIKRIELINNVKLIDGKKTVSANRGIYNAAINVINLYDNVVINEGNKTAHSDRFVYDMQSDKGTIFNNDKYIDNKVQKQRIRIIITDEDAKL